MPRDDADHRLVYSTGGEAPPEPPREDAPKTSGKGIRLRLENRASGRSVTVVTGLPGDKAAVAELARALRSSCNTGGSVKDGAIELQGDQREKAKAFLAAQGLKAR